MSTWLWGTFFAAGLAFATSGFGDEVRRNPAAAGQPTNAKHRFRSHHPDPFFRHQRRPSASCTGIKDNDERQLCRAITSGDALYCESIHDEGRRQLCRAEVRPR